MAGRALTTDLPPRDSVTFLLVRHAESEANAGRGALDGADPPLTSLGCAQALGLVEFFEGVPFDEIHSSDMQRATATIEPLAVRRRLPVQTTPHLREPVTDRRPTAFLPPEELAALLKDPSRLTAQPLPKLETHTRTS